jgi:hypothetical protein
MLTINGTTYKLVQLDTNVVSNILKAESDLLKNILDKYSPDEYILSFSPFTVIEIIQRSDLLDKFCQFFSIVPSIVLKGYEQIREYECDSYDSDVEFDIGLLSFTSLKKTGIFPDPKDIRRVITDKKVTLLEDAWLADRSKILNGIQNLVKNYQPKGEKYTEAEIKHFVKMVSYQQVEMLRPGWFSNCEINFDDFQANRMPSFVMMSFLVFYKFYSDNRKAILSDVFDLVISASFPYVEVIITEKSMFDSIQKMKKIDDFLEGIIIHKLNEF